ncbi:MAG: hypothetical protein NT161_00840 [Candidatus Nomurabacteria bacterium]|nr:hypothetical protein [Candidatus Nomurabacteria bacterium]
MKFNEGKENPMGILVVVIILAGVGYWFMKSSPTGIVENKVIPFPYSGDINGATTNNTNNNTNSANVVNKPISFSDITYGQALIVFKDARIQLDETCKAAPNNVTYKNNTNIMIDNRASVARTVKIDANYEIAAYSFKIIKLSSATLPVTWLLDCDKSQNVATVLVQE